MARFSSASRRKRAGTSLTAAVQRVTDPSNAFRKVYGGAEDDWQTQARNYLYTVGELRYYVQWRSNSASRMRLVASDIDPEAGTPTGSTDNLAVRKIVRDIGGGIGGQSQILKRMTSLLTVMGEGWLAMVVRDPEREENADGTPVDVRYSLETVEEWVALSRDEISTGGNRDVVVTLPDGVKHTLNTDVDIIFRIWEHDPCNAQLPDSPVRSNMAVLNEIMRATAAIDNAAQSRLIGNGILMVPQEMSFPNQKAPGSVPVDPEPPTTPQVEPSNSEELMDLLYDVGTTAIKDPNSMAAHVPVIIQAPGDYIKNVVHLKFGTEISETALKTREKAIQRLAMGLDVAPERLLGIGTNTNHWSAWAIGDDDIKVHIAPPVETICEALNKAILRVKLQDSGLNPDDFTIWYDATELTQDPDKKDEAQQAYDRGALTSPALLTHLGFDPADGYDLTAREGWVQLAMDRCSKDPNLIPLFAPLLGPLVEGIQAPAAPAAIEPPADPAADEPAPEAEPQTPQEPPADEALPAAAYAFTRVCVARAMELANKRRRTRANHSVYDGELPLDQIHIRLEPTSEAARLIAGWDSVLTADDVATFGLDWRRLNALVLDVAKDALGTSRAWRVTADQVAGARHVPR